MTNQDQQLIDACRSGQTEAFGELVLRYQDRLYNTLFKTLGSAEEAHDAAQDAFVLAFRKLDTFRGQSAFYSWLFRIAMNAAVSRLRKSKHKTQSLEQAKENIGLEPTDDHHTAHPEHALELTETQAEVQRALAELSDEFRSVLVLKEMEGLSYEEISQVLDCPIGTVRSRIHRARTELRGKLKSTFQTPME